MYGVFAGAGGFYMVFPALAIMYPMCAGQPWIGVGLGLSISFIAMFIWSYLDPTKRSIAMPKLFALLVLMCSNVSTLSAGWALLTNLSIFWSIASLTACAMIFLSEPLCMLVSQHLAVAVYNSGVILDAAMNPLLSHARSEPLPHFNVEHPMPSLTHIRDHQVSHNEEIMMLFREQPFEVSFAADEAAFNMKLLNAFTSINDTVTSVASIASRGFAYNLHAKHWKKLAPLFNAYAGEVRNYISEIKHGLDCMYSGSGYVPDFTNARESCDLSLQALVNCYTQEIKQNSADIPGATRTAANNMDHWVYMLTQLWRALNGMAQEVESACRATSKKGWLWRAWYHLKAFVMPVYLLLSACIYILRCLIKIFYLPCYACHRSCKRSRKVRVDPSSVIAPPPPASPAVVSVVPSSAHVGSSNGQIHAHGHAGHTGQAYNNVSEETTTESSTSSDDAPPQHLKRAKAQRKQAGRKTPHPALGASSSHVHGSQTGIHEHGQTFTTLPNITPDTEWHDDDSDKVMEEPAQDQLRTLEDMRRSIDVTRASLDLSRAHPRPLGSSSASIKKSNDGVRASPGKSRGEQPDSPKSRFKMYNAVPSRGSSSATSSSSAASSSDMDHQPSGRSVELVSTSGEEGDAVVELPSKPPTPSPSIGTTNPASSAALKREKKLNKLWNRSLSDTAPPKIFWDEYVREGRWKFPIRFMLTVGPVTALSFAALLYWTPGVDTPWAITSCVMVMMATMGASFRRYLHRFAGTILGAILGQAVALVCHSTHRFVCWGPLIFLTFFCAYFHMSQNARYTYFFQITLLTFCIVLFGAYPFAGSDVSWKTAGYRLLLVLIGSFFGSMSSFILPERTIDRYLSVVRAIVAASDKVAKNIHAHLAQGSPVERGKLIAFSAGMTTLHSAAVALRYDSMAEVFYNSDLVNSLRFFRYKVRDICFCTRLQVFSAIYDFGDTLVKHTPVFITQAELVNQNISYEVEYINCQLQRIKALRTKLGVTTEEVRKDFTALERRIDTIKKQLPPLQVLQLSSHLTCFRLFCVLLNDVARAADYYF